MDIFLGYVNKIFQIRVQTIDIRVCVLLYASLIQYDM